MPTSNPVPSQDPSDLLFNAEKLDEVVSGVSQYYTDRFGVNRRTMAGLSAEFPNAAANAAAAAASAIDAANEAASAAAAADAALAEATAAQEARTGAEAARDAAFVNANVYADTAAGLAATTNGQQFQVVSGDTIIRYKNNSGAAAEIARYPSQNTQVFHRVLGDDKTDFGTYSRLPSYASGTVSMNNDNTVNIPVGGDTWFNVPLSYDQIGATVVDVIIEVEQGAIDNLDLMQRNSSDTLLTTESDPINEGNGIWAARGIALQPTFAFFRVRMKNLSGSVAAKIKPPLISANGRVLAATGKSKNSIAAELLMAGKNMSAVNQFSGFTSFEMLVGSGGSVVGKTITVPASALLSAIFTPEQALLSTDTLTVVVKADGPFASLNYVSSTGVAGGSTAVTSVELRHIGDGWYIGTHSAAAGGGANPVYIDYRFDNRSGIGYVATGARKFMNFWVAKNFAGTIPAFVEAPAFVQEALLNSGSLTLYVDPAGSDSATGTKAAPLATIAEALSRGATQVMLRKVLHRTTGLAVTRRADFISYSGTNDTQSHARIWSSENLIGASFTATAADPNVYYRAMAVSPGAIWESTSSGLTRFGRVQADFSVVRAPFAQPEASEAGVREGAGRWWWGDGSAGTGLYLRPTDDSFTGRSYECPVANAGIALTGATVTFDGVEISLGRTNVVTLTRSTVVSRRSRFMRSGTSDAVAFAPYESHWLDEGDCLFAEAGDDGVNTDGGGAVFVSLGGSVARDNIGDGIAPHQNNQTIRLQGMRITANGKQGFVSVGTGTFELVDCDLRGNAETDLLIRLGALTGATTVRLKGCDADETEVTATTASTITATITGHRGPLQLQANATVRGHRNVRQGNDALRVDGGDVTAEDFYYSGGTDGVDIRGGSLTLRTGQILRNTTGIRQSGGTLTLDSAAPVNVYGNTTQFSGVSAEDQAKTLSIAAV